MKGGKMGGGRSVPTGVKVIAVLYYIGAVLSALFGVLFLVGAGAIGSLLSQIPILGTLGAGLFIVVGVIMIGFGVLDFFVGRGLWKARSWARVVVIVFAVLGAVLAIVSMAQGSILWNIFNLVVELVIGGYLIFSKDVKKAFA
jgi:hypothetical protein